MQPGSQYRRLENEGMASPLGCDEFLRASGAVVDVRSPAEFSQGHIPGAHNLPLFNDAERAEVGTLYKRSGRQAATQHGLALAGPRLAAITAEARAIAAGQEGPLRLHCWRGGLRSASVAWLLEEMADLRCLLLDGGYKCFRRWVRSALAVARPILILAGRTGSAKTEVLQAMDRGGAQVIDLEGLANHRGSSYGGLGLPAQPSSEHYENLLAITWNRMRPDRPVWLEAESVQVGRCRIPAELFEQMGKAPMVELVRPDEERICHLVSLYGGVASRRQLLEATRRIARRLGPQRSQRAGEAIEAGDLATAATVVLQYYDRAYAFELQRRGGSVHQVHSVGEGNNAIAARLIDLESTLIPCRPG